MAKRGPRGDIDRDLILSAATQLLEREGSIRNVSLRMLAREVGVASNALYTYFPSLDTVWDELRERLLGNYLDGLRRNECSRCGLREMLIAASRTEVKILLELSQRQSSLGKNSMRVAEEILRFCQEASIPAHNARNLVLSWMDGYASLRLNDCFDRQFRERARLGLAGDYPLEAAANAEPASCESDINTEIGALLTGIGLVCSCGQDPSGNATRLHEQETTTSPSAAFGTPRA